MKRAAAVTALALFTVVTAAPLLAQSGHDLFQQALRKERVEGDLRAAIALYQRIVTDYADDRPLVARALLQLGRAYETQDRASAERMYERVASDYADQRDAAAAARERLSDLRRAASTAANPAQLRLTEVRLSWSQPYHALSNDGTRIAYTDQDGDLAAHDLRTGRTTKLVERGGDNPDRAVRGAGAWLPVWSPDDRRIAYQRFHDYWKQEIEIVTVATGEVRHTEVNALPQSWARNGMILAIEGVVGDFNPRLRLLPEGGGAARTLAADFDPSGFPVLSPDGVYLAYARNVDGNVDIYVAPTAGGEPVRITSEPGMDTSPLWSADGAHLLFKSDRNLNRLGLWVVPMGGGQPAGPPILVRPDVGEGLRRPFSWSRDGKLLFTTSRSVAHLYSLDVVPATFETRGAARKLTDAPEYNREPAVSPDGTRIAYLAASGPGSATTFGTVLRVIGIDGRSARDVVTDILLPPVGSIGWLDDDEVVVAGMNSSRADRGIYAVSTRTGAARALFVSDELLGHTSVSPDRTRVAFHYGRQDPQIHVVGVDGSGLTRLTSADAPAGYRPRWSPDGRWIAYHGARRGTGIVAVNVETGEQRRLVGGDTLTNYLDSDWSPDGRHLVYATNTGRYENPSLWIARTDGSGAPLRLRIDVPGVASPGLLGTGLSTVFTAPRWTPDGSSIVFSAGSSTEQLWIMEGFLPDPVAGRR